ncbi:MAG TPA: DUF4390 domain-containing protein [Steroidobacteraceae bacterium]|jgi:hypothetical protein|nr:DUF4390 domain-containing protein [Steroidobacteraceae bacterium]
MHSRRAFNLLSLLCALGAALFSSTVSRADALDGVLEVRSAYATIDQGVFQLFARVIYPVNDDIRAALKDGLTLTFDLDVVVSRERRFWMDETVREVSLKRELTYHAVSDRYVTRDVDPPNGTEQRSFATLEEALEALGTVEAWPFLLSNQLTGTRQYRVSLRAGVRRGRLPDTLRVLLFWTDDWHRESEWFSWSLQR